MADPIQGTLHVDRYLTNYSHLYLQDSARFVALRASSLVPVNNKSDSYVIYDRGSLWRDEMEKRPLGGRPARASYGMTEGSYTAEEWGLEHSIDDRQRKNTDAPISLDEGATRLLTQKGMIRRDRLWAEAAFKAGVWSHDFDGVAGSPSAGEFLQFDQSGSDPIETVDAYKNLMDQNTGFMPNVAVFGANTYTRLRHNQSIKDDIKYTQRASVTLEILAAMFELENVAVARAVYNSAAEGATDTFERIVDPNAMWLGYIEKGSTLNSPTAVTTFAWNDLVPGAMNEDGVVIERGREDLAHSDVFQARSAHDTRVTAPDLGIFLDAAVSG